MPKNRPDKKLKGNWRRQAARIRRLLRASRTKDALLFMAFICVSFVFWLILALNDDTQREMRLALEITDVPSEIKFISEPPEYVQVSVRDKGTVLANYSLGGSPALKVRYSDMVYDEVSDRVVLGEQALGARVRNAFGATTQVVSVRPDSLSLVITDRAPTLATVTPDIDVVPSPQFVISGPVTVSPDTVRVYSARHLRVRPRKVTTVKVAHSGAKDTLVFETRLLPVAGTRFEPDRVTVTVPVEPLISKTREVPVQLIQAANRQDIVLFPSRVKVSYLLPMSLYDSETGVVTVSADFSQRSATRIPLSVGSLPDYYRGVELSTDSVEYLIEARTSLHSH